MLFYAMAFDYMDQYPHNLRRAILSNIARNYILYHFWPPDNPQRNKSPTMVSWCAERPRLSRIYLIKAYLPAFSSFNATALARPLWSTIVQAISSRRDANLPFSQLPNLSLLYTICHTFQCTMRRGEIVCRNSTSNVCSVFGPPKCIRNAHMFSFRGLCM